MQHHSCSPPCQVRLWRSGRCETSRSSPLPSRLLVHGHVAFIGIMGIYVLVVGFAWLVLHRLKTNYRPQLLGAKGPLVASAVILFVFALPIALELVLHWPGEFGLYLDYITSNARSHPHSVAQVTSYMEQFWPGGSTGTVLLTAVGLGTAVLAFRDEDRRRRAFVIALLAAVVVMTVEVWWYVYKGVDYLNVSPKGYEGYFYYSVPALIVAALVVEACGYVEVAFSDRTARRRLASGAVGASALIMRRRGGRYKHPNEHAQQRTAATQPCPEWQRPSTTPNFGKAGASPSHWACRELRRQIGPTSSVCWWQHRGTVTNPA